MGYLVGNFVGRNPQSALRRAKSIEIALSGEPGVRGGAAAFKGRGSDELTMENRSSPGLSLPPSSTVRRQPSELATPRSKPGNFYPLTR